MTDTDQISKLLVTLEPLASSLHFCIIGEERRGRDDKRREENGSQMSNGDVWGGSHYHQDVCMAGYCTKFFCYGTAPIIHETREFLLLSSDVNRIFGCQTYILVSHVNHLPLFPPKATNCLIV